MPPGQARQARTGEVQRGELAEGGQEVQALRGEPGVRGQVERAQARQPRQRLDADVRDVLLPPRRRAVEVQVLLPRMRATSLGLGHPVRHFSLSRRPRVPQVTRRACQTMHQHARRSSPHSHPALVPSMRERGAPAGSRAAGRPGPDP